MPIVNVRAHMSHSKKGKTFNVRESKQQRADKTKVVAELAREIAEERTAKKPRAKKADAALTEKKAIKPANPAPKKASANSGAPKATKAAAKGKPAAPAAPPTKKTKATNQLAGEKVTGKRVKTAPVPEAAPTPKRQPKQAVTTHPEAVPKVKAPTAKTPKPKPAPKSNEVDISKPRTEVGAPEAEGKSEAAIRRAQRRTIYDQHLTAIAHKRHLEAKLFTANDGEKTKLREQLGEYKAYTPELIRELHGAVLQNMEPMLLGESARWMRKIGLEPQVDDRGRPAGTSFYSDLAQTARESAWRVIQRHDPLEHRNALDDQVRSTVQKDLFEKWRSIIGASPVKVSAADNASLTQLSKVRAALDAELGRAPTEIELAAAMERDQAEVRRLQQLAHTVISAHLDAKAKADEEEGPTLGETIADSRAPLDEHVIAGDQGERLEKLLHGAIAKIADPRARYALVVSAEIDDGGKAMKAVIRDEHMPQMVHVLEEAKRSWAKQQDVTGGSMKYVTPEDIVQRALTLSGVPAKKQNPESQKYKLMLNLLKYDLDPVKLLTETKDTKDVEGGKKTWIAVSDVFERMGYSASQGRKLLMNAKKELADNAALRKFHDEELSKALLSSAIWTPELLLFRHLMDGDALRPQPDTIVKMWSADLDLIKSLAPASNVYTALDLVHGFAFQMAIEPIGFVDLLSKGIGTEMEQKHPGGRWVTIGHRHVFIDKGGTIQAGPHGFVGHAIAALGAHLAAGNSFGEHSHSDQEGEVERGHYVAHHEGKTVHIRVRHVYAPQEKGADKHGTKLMIHSVTDADGNHLLEGKNGKRLQSARGVYQHLGLDLSHGTDTGKGVISVNWAKELQRAIDTSPDSDLSTAIANRIAAARASQVKLAIEGRGSISSAKSTVRKEAEEAAKPVDFHQAAQGEDGSKVFSAQMRDGHAVNIKVGRDGHVHDGYWGALLGNAVVHSADDLNRKLRSLAGTSSVIHLSNGGSHYLLHVTYDHKGTPIITQGPLAGKRLHEVMTENGGLKTTGAPVEHNGQKLYAGYNSKEGRTTALGNWTKERAYEHFGAVSDDEKAAVDAKLAEADKAIAPELPRVSLEKHLTSEKRRQWEQKNADRKAKGLPPLEEPPTKAVVTLNDDPSTLKMAEALERAGYGAKNEMNQKQREKAIAELAQINPELPNLDIEGQTALLTRAHQLAKTLHAIKQEGHGGLHNLEHGKRGLVVPIDAIDKVAAYLGGVKLQGDTLARLQRHRQEQAEEADLINGFDKLGTHVYGPEGKAIHAVPGLKTHMPNGMPIGFTHHQQKVVHHYANSLHTVSALGVGNGKTSSALAAAEVAKAQNKDAPKRQLVIVPSQAQVTAWKDDASKFFGITAKDGRISVGKDVHPNAEYHVITRAMFANPATRVGRRKLKDVMAEAGVTKEQLHDPAVQKRLADEHGVQSHELFTKSGGHSPNKLVGGKPIAQHLKEQGFDGVILDEAHEINSANAEGKATRDRIDAYMHGLHAPEIGLDAGKHGKAKGIMALTGTPIQNNLIEQHGLVQLTHRGDHDLGTAKNFLRKYGEKGDGGRIVGIKEDYRQELGNKLARYMVTSTNEDLNEEMRPPSATVQDLDVHLGSEHDALLREHDAELHSVGGQNLLEAAGADEAPKSRVGGGALAAIARSTRDLHELKRPAVEAHIRSILSGDPHAKIILASGSVDGQKMLGDVAKSVLGEYQGDAAREHLSRALPEIDQQMHEEAASHRALRERLQGEHEETRGAFERHQALEHKRQNGELEAHEAAEHAQLSPDAERHAELGERLENLPEHSNTYKRLAQARQGILDKVGGSDADRLGYKYGVIRTHVEEEGEEGERKRALSSKEREQAVRDFNDDEAHKILVVSSNIAKTGVNLGRGTHIVDLDGDYNPSNLEQLYGRHARLTGSVPKAIVHRVIARSETAGVSTIDEKKATAAARKAAVASQVRQAARTGRVEAPDAPLRVRAHEMGITKPTP